MELVQKFSERLGCILRSAIGMEHQSLRSPPLFIGFPKGIHDQSGIRLVRELPRDNLAGEQVDDDAEIAPFSARFDIGKIADPDQIRGVLRKPLLQMIAAGIVLRAGRMGRAMLWPVC